jgi:hypothetical protein
MGFRAADPQQTLREPPTLIDSGKLEPVKELADASQNHSIRLHV